MTARDQAAVLSGDARSWSEGEEAERAAWSVAGVVRVGDLIVVEPGAKGLNQDGKCFYGCEDEGALCV